VAARTKRIVHDENTRKKIQTSQIINRLTKHILGTIDLTTSQVRAAEILLNKTLPNLAATHNTEETGKTLEEWLNDLPPETFEAEE
jgi:hypothetical protein